MTPNILILLYKRGFDIERSCVITVSVVWLVRIWWLKASTIRFRGGDTTFVFLAPYIEGALV